MNYVFSALSTYIQAYHNCIKRGNTEWIAIWESKINNLTECAMPRGSGFDSGTQFDLESSNSEKLVFTTAYHHMNDRGYYTKWTSHKIIVTPGLVNIKVRITGPDYNGIKDYIYSEAYACLHNKLENLKGFKG